MGRKRKGGGNDARRIVLDDAEITRLFDGGATAAELAICFGCSTHPIKKALARLGLRRAACPRPGVGAGDKNPQWRGGRRLRTDGYVAVWTPSGETLEHRVVIEESLGRPLYPREVVHHLDEDKQNNSISNLEVTTQSDHIRYHLCELRIGRYGK